MANPQARQSVGSPPFTPLPYGLLSVVEMPVPDGVHWANGVETQGVPCDEAGTTTDSCPPGTVEPTPITKTPTSDGVPVYGADPFTVYALVDCGPVGRTSDEFIALTRSALDRGEGRAVERVFWTGVTEGDTINPHLAANAEVVSNGAIIQVPATPVVTGAAVDLVRGLGELEGALGECYGGEGIIHMPGSLAASADAWGLLKKDGERLRTLRGNRVALYSSNNRQGPDGTLPAAGSTWIYGTGMVSMRRGDIKDTGRERTSLDRSKNTMVQVAERTYVLNWNCCNLAVLVNLGTGA